MATRKSALVVIDVQVNILATPGVHRPAVQRRFDEVRGRIAGLVNAAHRFDVPVVFVQHDGALGHRLESGTAGWAICEDLNRRAEDAVVRKAACDSFHDTNLQVVLSGHGVDHLVIAGLMTPYCIDTTCRRAVSLGYDVTLVADAHTTADTDLFTVEQIVAHHNSVLDGLDAGAAALAVVPASDVHFA